MDIGLAEQVAIEAAEAAGAWILNGVREEVAVSPKGTDGNDVLTSLEPVAERCIVERIRRDFPAHRIYAEESGLLEGTDRDHVWVVDPLDGSNNVAIGLHNFAVGVALCADGLPVLGVVHDPITGHTWRAVRDRGFQPVVPPERWGCASVVAWTQGHGVKREDPTARSLKLVLDSHAGRVLQLWAPLISWVMLARGVIDGFVGYRAEPWEMPAGTILAREAGIVVRDLDGTPFDERVDGVMEPRSFVAARADVIDDLLEWVREAEAMRPRLKKLLLNGG